MLNLIIIKWLSNDLVGHVFELFKNLKFKNKRHEESFGVASWYWSCNFKTYIILFVFHSYFEHCINKGHGHLISH
jgi:hypothetical protein